MKVILISGKAQNGKDTVAGFLKEQLKQDGYDVLITHFGDLLKYICTNYFDWNGEKDESGRRLLQYVGTDIIRKQNPTLWVDFVSSMLEYFNTNWDYVIIPDCRFPNEISTMIDNGFDIIHLRVVREDFNSPLSKEQQNHLSETALNNVTPDYLINNSGTLEELYQKVNKFVHNLLKGRCDYKT